jgi:hypothetical protein
MRIKNDDGRLKCWIEEDGVDRCRTKTRPVILDFGCAFYHYPRTMSDEKAFQKLRATMSKSYDMVINNLTKKQKQLQTLQLKRKVNGK